MSPAKQAALEGASSRVRRRNYGKSHSYFLMGEDGQERKLDGVTTLIGDGLPKPALMNWAGNVTAEKAVDRWEELSTWSVSKRLDYLKKARFEDRDTAAAKGTLIHDLSEQLVAGKEVEIPDEVRPHVDSAVRFLDEFQVRPLLTETTCYSVRGGHAGTLDLVFTSDLFPGKVILGDWKTSRSGIYDEAALQLSAYRHSEFYVGPDGLDHPMAELGVTDTWGIWIRSDGYDVYPLDTDVETYRFFQYIATVARRARALKESPLKGAPLDRPSGVAA